MPATRERTDELLEATCRVVARQGAHGLRMSDVAGEAGVSNSLLHYYFATKAELLGRAFAHAEERVFERARAELDALPTAAARLDRFLSLYVEKDVVFEENWVLWNEMWSSALFDEELRPAIESAYRRWVGFITELLHAGREDGSVPRDVDADDAGARLAALVDGIGSQVVLGLTARARAAALIRRAIELELSGRTQRGRA